MASAAGDALSAIEPPDIDQSFHIHLHKELRYGFGDAAMEIAITGFGRQLRQIYSVVGYRVFQGSDETRNSILAVWPDGHLMLNRKWDQSLRLR